MGDDTPHIEMESESVALQRIAREAIVLKQDRERWKATMLEVATELAERAAYWTGQLSGVPANTTELATSYAALASRLLAALGEHDDG